MENAAANPPFRKRFGEDIHQRGWIDLLLSGLGHRNWEAWGLSTNTERF